MGDVVILEVGHGSFVIGNAFLDCDSTYRVGGILHPWMKDTPCVLARLAYAFYLLKCFETLHELKTDDDNVELVMT